VDAQNAFTELQFILLSHICRARSPRGATWCGCHRNCVRRGSSGKRRLHWR